MVLVYGTVCWDRLKRVPALPPLGGYVSASEAVDAPGGEALNTALALSRLGVPTRLVGNPVGDDLEGTAIRRAATEWGLDVLGGAPLTAVCDILVTPDGERTMIGLGFDRLAEATLPPLPLVAGEWFTAEPNHGALARAAARRAAEAGMQVYLMDFDHLDDLALPRRVLQTSTDWVPGKGNPAEAARWAADVAARTEAPVILTDGAFGLTLAEPGRAPRWIPAPPFPAAQVVDATGAGDAFRAGCLMGLVEGQELEEAVRWGACTAALSTRALGACAAHPTREEVAALRAEWRENS